MSALFDLLLNTICNLVSIHGYQAVTRFLCPSYTERLKRLVSLDLPSL